MYRAGIPLFLVFNFKYVFLYCILSYYVMNLKIELTTLNVSLVF